MVHLLIAKQGPTVALASDKAPAASPNHQQTNAAWFGDAIGATFPPSAAGYFLREADQQLNPASMNNAARVPSVGSHDPVKAVTMPALAISTTRPAAMAFRERP